MQHRKLTTTALVTRNSLSYIENVFALNEARTPLINVPDEAFANSLTGIDVARCMVPDEGTGWFSASHALIYDDRPAQITFTSGTEGKPKGIVLTYANLADAADRIISQMGLTADVREYVGVPVTYSFGIGRIRCVSAAGGRSYLPPRGFDPLEIARMLKSGEINALSAVPTLLRILLRTPEVIGSAGKNLRWMEIGSQYMSAAEKRAIRELFPNAKIVQHYGLTEASRSTFLQVSDASDKVLESVGRPVGATEIGISTEGRIQIRGPHVAHWRIDDDQLLDLRDEDGWLETSDLGHMKDGYLYYDGRADDLINSGGVKINPDMLEARITKLLGQSGKVVVTKVPDPVRGEGILVASEATDLSADELKSTSVEALKQLGLHVGDALHVTIVPAIPRTTTGKPLRRILTQEFVEQSKSASADGLMERMPEQEEAANVHIFFERFFPGRVIGMDDSFETMGGDSLSYIQFSLGFEERFGALPSGWESMTVAELERIRASQAGSVVSGWRSLFSWRVLEAATLTRAFFMICIVALHLDTFYYSRNWGAAYFLFMLCGYSVMRFQWPEISRTGRVGTLFSTILRVAIPTILVTAIMQLWARTLEIKPLELISNWFDAHQYHVAYYYFAEIYMQLLLVLAVILSIPAARAQLKKRPMMSSAALMIMAMAVSWGVDQVWDTNYLYHRTPIWYLWTVGAGMLMASARDLQSRILSLVLISVAVVMHHGFTPASGYIVSACALLLIWPEIKVPSIVKIVVGEIAGSSMFMYLSHFQVKSLVTKVFHTPMPWVALFVAIIGGIIFARIYNWAEGKVRASLRAHGGVSVGSTS